MKVALLGNMNNNNFAMLRYLVDVGVDAYLVLFKDDGEGSLAHFRPEDDSWYLDKWEKRIVRVDYYADWRAFYPDFKNMTLAPSANKIRESLKAFDFYIGSGMMPAIFDKAGIELNIFYPYATGVEMIGTNLWPSYFRKKFSIRKWLYQRLIDAQIRGVKNAHNCLNAELGPTKDTLDRLGVVFEEVPIPMVYIEKVSLEQIRHDEQLMELLRQMESCDLKVMSHARHWWVNKQALSGDVWQGYNKNNNWLIEGFGAFVKAKKDVKACLLLLEYGDDLNESKALVSELSLTDKVVWIPKMARRKLIYLMSLMDIGVGEFTVKSGTIWGGTGWETLAVGKPMLQTFNFTVEEYRKNYGHEPPPILDVKSPADIVNHFTDFVEDREKFVRMGKDAQDWFATHNGVGLIKRWLKTIVRSSG